MCATPNEIDNHNEAARTLCVQQNVASSLTQTATHSVFQSV